MNAMIKEMVSRFLGWKIPKDFAPDAGIRFAPGPIQQPDGPHWPSGTNLFHAGQAQEMFKHCLPAISQAAQDVLAERRRQVEVECWMPAGDDEYTRCQLARAAATYAAHAAFGSSESKQFYGCLWPFPGIPKTSTPRRDLVKAGALILAEIERLDRAEVAKSKPSSLGESK